MTQHRIAGDTHFGYVPALDGCRAVSIGIVFLGHAGLAKVFPGGFGVTVFFFLSGYLITSLLRDEFVRTDGIAFGDFYARRFLRLGPPLLIAMAVLGGLTAFGAVHAQINPVGVAAQILFMSNYATLFGYGENGVPGMPLWSLAVEEHFYLVFPVFALWAMRRWDGARMAMAMALACVVVLLIRCVHVFVFHDTFYTYYLSHTRIDAIVFGCILAVWQNPVMDAAAWRPGPMALALAVATLAIGFAIAAPAFRETVRYSLQGAALFVLFAALLHARGGLADRLLASRPLVAIGRWSYTFYLVHYFALLAARAHLALPPVAIAVVAGGLALAFSAAMYAVVERPIAIMRRKLRAA
jgi:peptidoglycan/LPS O-acetylase OafA/YrhL